MCALKSLSVQYSSRNLQNDTSLESTSIWIKEAPVEAHESLCLRSLGFFFSVVGSIGTIFSGSLL